MTNLVMTWASGEAFCRSEGFSVYLNSLNQFKERSIRKVILTHDMPEDIREKISLLYDTRIVDIDKDKIHYILRDRHWAFWDFLYREGHMYDSCLITDSKDVIFQANPFDFKQVGLVGQRVVLANEGFKHKDSGWNLIDQLETQSNVREFKKELRDFYVINGGVMMGGINKLKDLLLLLWTNAVRATGNCTDQGVLNYLYTFLQRDMNYEVVGPHVYNFCLTGEGVKEGFVEAKFIDGEFYNYLSEKYYIVHQWDRLKESDIIKQKYLGDIK